MEIKAIETYYDQDHMLNADEIVALSGNLQGLILEHKLELSGYQPKEA